MQLPSFIHQLDDHNYEMFVDNHLLSVYSVCPLKFFYQHILNQRQKGGMGFYPAYGIWWHDVLEQFYEHLHEGFSVEQLFVIAAKLWSDQDMTRFALLDTKRYEKMVEGYGDTTVGGQFVCPVSALSMAKQYYDTYYEQDRQQWKILSVESGFGHEREVRLGTVIICDAPKLALEEVGVASYNLAIGYNSLLNSTEVAVYYTGRPDLIVLDSEGRIFPIDHKSTDEIRNGVDNQYKPHSETAGYIYSIATILNKPVDRCVINMCAREIPAAPRDKSKEPKPRFKRVHPFYTEAELQEWARNALAKCEEIARLAITTQDMPQTWQMRETQCFQWGQPCEYHQVDRVTPASRDTVFKANFVTADEWAPYKKEIINASK